jgi:copper resistance protein C
LSSAFVSGFDEKGLFMRFLPTLAVAAALAGSFVVQTPALAHTRVVSSMPAEGATARSVRMVTLTFSEALLPPTAAASLVMTGMPGMDNHGEMTIRNFTVAWSNANRTMTLNLRQPLKAGAYEVRWQAAGADGHRMTGTVKFVVS